jgi:hypothetical protein
MTTRREEIYRDRIEIPMRIVIDVTDQPEDLAEATKAFLRRLVSADEGDRALAMEDIVWAIIGRADCLGPSSWGQEADDAINDLHGLQALSAEPGEGIMCAAATERMLRHDTRRDIHHEGHEEHEGNTKAQPPARPSGSSPLNTEHLSPLPPIPPSLYSL